MHRYTCLGVLVQISAGENEVLIVRQDALMMKGESSVQLDFFSSGEERVTVIEWREESNGDSAVIPPEWERVVTFRL